MPGPRSGRMERSWPTSGGRMRPPPAGPDGQVVRARLPPPLGRRGRHARAQAEVHPGAVPGPDLVCDPPAAVAGGLGLLVAQRLGRRAVRPPTPVPDESRLAAEEARHLLVRLDRLHAPRTPAPPPAAQSRHWVNSSASNNGPPRPSAVDSLLQPSPTQGAPRP